MKTQIVFLLRYIKEFSIETTMSMQPSHGTSMDFDLDGLPESVYKKKWVVYKTEFKFVGNTQHNETCMYVYLIDETTL